MEKYAVPHDAPDRLRARLTAVDCWVNSGRDMGDAIKLFDITWNEPRIKAHLPHIKAPDHFVPYQVNKLYEHFTLLDLTEHPHPPKMPDEVVKQCADIMAYGYDLPMLLTTQTGTYQWWETRHFTSFKQACNLSTALQQHMANYDVTPKYLLRRMHEVVPDLVWSALPMKMELTPAQKAARMEYAAWLLELHEKNPNFLKRILFGDETRIYLGKEESGKLKVYHYRGDTDGHAPLENPLLNKENTIRLDLLLFVNASLGVVYYEFLTGTKDIKTMGRRTGEMRAVWEARLRDGKGPYKTKKSQGKTDAKSATMEEFVDNLNCFLPRTQNTALDTPEDKGVPFNYLVSVDGCSIHKLMKEDYSLGYASTFLPHPAYSPDLHQVIEHRFAELKQYLVNRVYHQGFENVDVGVLRGFVADFFNTVTPVTIEADLINLVNCYRVVATPTYCSVLINGVNVQGVGGGWPPKRFR